MSPAARRNSRRTTPTRPRRAGRVGRAFRRGFTLVEMLVSVTLVLMMMLMFAEIYSLAQGTMSTQKGIAENDQKARILSEVIRRDLDTRTFRSVYPFRLEPSASFASANDQASNLISLRRGYFSISENDPSDDTDDVLQLTVDVGQPGYGGAGDRVYGKAGPQLDSTSPNNKPYPLTPSPPLSPEPQTWPTPTTSVGAFHDRPEYDDGIAGNGSGMSSTAEVSYFLRDGNLYRAVLLVRDPYVSTSTGGQPSLDPAWAGANPLADYFSFSRQYPSSAYPNVAPSLNPPRSVWNDFDFSVYRTLVPPAFSSYEWRFHGPGSLSNDPTAEDIHVPAYLISGGNSLHVPDSLGVPHLRFGHTYTMLGQPFEFDSTLVSDYATVTGGAGTFFGRFTAEERSSPAFTFPGTDFGPFDDGLPVRASYTGGARVGVDLLLSNVHSFDIQVWDDVIGNYVNLGYDDPDNSKDQGVNPYTGNTEYGFYHASRLRRPYYYDSSKHGAWSPAHQYMFDHPLAATDFGNRYDTWHPRMVVVDGSGNRYRNGRAPYRPQRTNPDPNTDGFNAPNSTDPNREAAMAFADDTIDDDHDANTGGGTVASGDTDDTDAEAPLRAIRIVVRFIDATSGQLRQETIEASLID